MGGRLQVMRRVLGNPSLRRVVPAFLGFGAGENGVWVAVLVYAYRHGGVTMAAVIAAVQLVPAALVAPGASELADRRGRRVTLRASYLAQAVSLLVTGVVFLATSVPALGYAWAVVAASAVTLTRPAQAALLPRLVRTPSELTGANVACGWVESASFLVGPALAGILIALDGPGLAVLAFGVVLLGCAALVADAERHAGGAGALVESEPAPDPGAERVGLVALCFGERPVAMLLALFAVQFVALGSLDVLVVVLALQELSLGSSGAGYLSSMFGLGAVLGGLGAIGLVGHRRLARPLLVAAIVWGASMGAMAGWPAAVPVFALLAVVGASRVIFDVAGRTLLHRAVAPRVHGRIFGALEGLEMAGLAVGSLAVPALISAGGAAAALIGVGATLVIVSAAAVTGLGRLADDLAADPATLALVRGNPLFTMLSPPVLEDLVRALVAVQVPAGEAVVREGEGGDRYFIVAAGTLRVTIAGEPIRTLGRGDGFGEIALLRDGVRTATVTAVQDVSLLALGRAPFLEALGASSQARHAADALVGERLAV